MELNDWNSDLITIAETARVMHVPQQYAARPAKRTDKSTISELFTKRVFHGTTWAGAGMNKSNGDLMTNTRRCDFEPLLTVEEAAAHLKYHPKTVQKKARAGEVPGLRMGKYWRFRLSALDAYVRSLENDCSQPFRVK
jgi:excisionase family DNA binding protein